MTIAFVLSGGGSLGAVQVGMLRALSERGVQPDLIVGTSVGALNGAFLAQRCTPDGITALGDLWKSLRRRDVFPIAPLQGALGYYGAQNWLVPSTRLAMIIREQIGFVTLEHAPIPLHVVATELVTGREVLLSSGDTVKAILASAAIPGVFPPVKLDARELVDGGVANNTPLSHAFALGATNVYILPAGHACALEQAPKGALGVALQSLTQLIGRGLAADIEHYQGRYQVHVVPPLCPLAVSPTDFSRADELIERAYRSTVDWLDNGGGRSTAGLHPHPHP